VRKAEYLELAGISFSVQAPMAGASQSFPQHHQIIKYYLNVSSQFKLCDCVSVSHACMVELILPTDTPTINKPAKFYCLSHLISL